MRKWRVWSPGALAAFAICREWINPSRLLLPPVDRTAMSFVQHCKDYPDLPGS